MKVGYARVSSDDQSLEIQIKELEAAGCERIYEEKVSGKNAEDREQLQAVIKFVRDGDTVVVTKLDRMARNTLDMLTIIQDLSNRKVKFISLAEPWANTDSPAGELILTIIAGVADFERKRIRERQMAGIEAAKAKGVYKRERKRRSDKRRRQLTELKKQYPYATATQLGRLAGVSGRTVYRLLPGQFRDKPEYLINPPPRDIEANPLVAPPSAQEECEKPHETADFAQKPQSPFRIFSRTAPNARG